MTSDMDSGVAWYVAKDLARAQFLEIQQSELQADLRNSLMCLNRDPSQVYCRLGFRVLLIHLNRWIAYSTGSHSRLLNRPRQQRLHLSAKQVLQDWVKFLLEQSRQMMVHLIETTQCSHCHRQRLFG